MRRKLMTGILAMMALLVCTVTLFSPYAPVVGPMIDIEAIWAIEDEREESEKPLVTRLENNGQALGYDAESDTFYCTLGMEQTEAWPDIHLTAPGAKGVSLCFADDYSYDWCSEAIAEGVAYQILTYTEEEFWYTQVVFTGLPIMCLQADEPIGAEEQAGHAAVSGYGMRPVQADAWIRLRGASTFGENKGSYKVTFAGNSRGKKLPCDLPGLGTQSEIALLAMLVDKTMMRDKLSWALYAALTEDDAAFRARKTQHVEVFVNDEYRGVYLMVEIIDAKEELARAGEGHLQRDSVYRSTCTNYARDRVTMEDPLTHEGGFGYELRYTPMPGRTFEDLQPYLDMLTEEDDEAFARRALETVDIDQLLRYVLYVQACGLNDNFHNNMFIWAEKTETGRRYSFYPWDLDLSWGNRPSQIGAGYDRWLYFPLADRIINLDVDGARSRIAQMWKEMRRVFTQENIAGMLERYATELAESGAMMRNEMKWNMSMSYPESYELLDFAGTRFVIMDEIIALIAGTDERLPFLEVSYSETTGVPALDWETAEPQEGSE